MQIRIIEGQPYPLGTYLYSDGLNISYVSKDADCGIVLFDKGSEKELTRIPFPQAYTIGNVHCMKLQGVTFTNVSYCFYEKDRLKTDIRGKAYTEGSCFGQPIKLKDQARLALLPDMNFDWMSDKNPHIPYETSIVYGLHVRGFTKHSSSKVKGKGTFRGVIEKIPYLQDLGITTLEFQPFYEFEELDRTRKNLTPYMSSEKEYINYWGYKEGYYYSPKKSYSISENAVNECKEMVRELHRAGMEVIMQFYFTENMALSEIPEVLRFWIKEYHVDGFHLKGNIPDIEQIVSDPALAQTKIWYYQFAQRNETSDKYLAEYKDQYRVDMRKLLKGDEAMVKGMMYHLLHNPNGVGQINYLTNYDGFTLMDLVSYDKKHNESNGEDNHDGNDFNDSWNCGQEGKSRKKAVTTLRHKQIKNALLLLFLSQGTPLIFMGDEFGNTQDGNNNPYCQDNSVTWLNWNLLDSGAWIRDFVKDLIWLRKSHPVLRQAKELRLMDYGACGYPDASFHGEDPWKPDVSPYSRQLGIMYCGKYAWITKKVPDDFFYIAYNLHWEEHPFALPKLPKDMEWHYLLSSCENILFKEDSEQTKVMLPGRSICVFESGNLMDHRKAEG